MVSRRLFVVSILVILSMLFGSTGTVLAQQPPPAPAVPGEKPGGSLGPYRQHAEQMRSAGRDAVTGDFLQSTNGVEGAQGGPEVGAEADVNAQASSTDAFGYARKSVAFNWVDASGGTEMDFTANEVQTVALPFTFNFYENSYTSVKMTRYGYLSFSEHPMIDWQAPILTPYEPNNVIAPYWGPLYLDGDSHVYVQEGGAAPNRYVIFQWSGVSDVTTSGGNDFNFQAVLMENGDILFQYAGMTYGSGYSFASAGIEDNTGATGVVSLKYKSKQKSNRAVLFIRPTAGISVKVFPSDYGAFAAIGGSASHTITVVNTGTSGDDVFDVRVSSSSKWPAVAYAADGVTPLTDTDGDGRVDTGPVASGASVDVVVQVTAPSNAKVGSSWRTSVTFTSSLKKSRKKMVVLTTTIPATFTQVYARDNLSQIDVLGLNVSPVNGVQSFDVALDSGGYSPVVTRMANGSAVYAWSEYVCPDFMCEQVFFSVRDANGAEVLAPTGLAVPPSGTWDFNVAAATASNGNIGLTFVREVFDGTSYVYNIFFVLVDSTGAILAGPTSVTSNTSSSITFYKPVVVTNDDDQFLVAYEQFDSTTSSLSDIYLASFGVDGSVLNAPAALTTDPGDGGGYYGPSLTVLPGGQLLVAYNGWRAKGRSSWTEYAYYTVLANAGADVVLPETGISLGRVDSYGMDSVLLSNGQVLMAWGEFKSNRESIYYAVLKAGTYKKAKGAVPLVTRPALTGSWYVSVTSDTEGNGILTWADDYQTFGRHLYYAMIGNNGALRTRPVVFMTSAQGSYLYLTPNGYGNTTYTP